MDSVAEQAAFGLLEYGLAGIFILVLLSFIYYSTKAAAKERAAQEERDNARETALRETVAKSFDQRHDDSILTERRLSRIEASLQIEAPHKDA
jgi:hypothetical protein